MSNYPTYAEIDNIKYPINADFRIALKCNKVAESDISNEERSLAIIYLLYGEKGLKSSKHWENLLRIAMKYLSCGEETDRTNKECNMSYEEDMKYIRTSFFYDYKIDLNKEKMHWWEFYEKLSGLSDKCVLSRVRYIRDFDISEIKDRKEKEKWIEQKKLVSLNKKKIMKKSEKEIELDQLFREQINPKRR